MPVVTIRGQMGSGAPELGKLVADKLQIDYVDREIIADVANKIKWSQQGVADKETPPGTLLGRIAEALAKGYAANTPYSGGSGYIGAYLPIGKMPIGDVHYLTGLESVIKKLADSDSVVIRGRGSQFILKNQAGALHVLVVAPEKQRVNRIMNSQNLSESDARKEMNRSDSSHREFIKRYFQADLEEPVNYDIVINTANVSFEDASGIIIEALRAKEKASKRALRGSGKKQESSEQIG